MNNISFIGMAGSGKSTLGKALSEKLEVSFADTDFLIEERFSQSLEDLKQAKGYKFLRLAEEGIILSLQNEIKIISTGDPSSRNGISSSLTTLETIPLFPCLPANLSPTFTFLF